MTTSPGDKLIRPMNAPAAAAPVAGVQPGTSQATVIANTVIVYGSAGGIYVYSGTPAAGNLIASIDAPGGLDPYGLNNTVAGIASYASLSPGYEACQLLDAAVQFYTSSSYAGAYTLLGAIEASVADEQFQFLDLPLISAAGTAANPTQISTDSWNMLTNPTGITGTIRYKLLPLQNMAVLDVNCSITSTSATATNYQCGSDLSAACTPANATQPGLAVNQHWSTEANASPRAGITTGGVVTLAMPAFVTSGQACAVYGTCIYPLD